MSILQFPSGQSSAADIGERPTPRLPGAAKPASPWPSAPLLTARQWLLQRALNKAIGDPNRFYLAVAQQFLELAVRYGRDLFGRRDEVLDEQHADDRRDGITDMEVICFMSSLRIEPSPSRAFPRDQDMGSAQAAYNVGKRLGDTCVPDPDDR